MNIKPTASTQQIIRFKNVPVITTEQLAQLYGTATDNIKMNFSRNKLKFIEGKHFFKIEGSELREFKNRVTQSYSVQKNARSLILWTERGAARHAKMLDTDFAWEVFERLEDSYFKQAVPVVETQATVALTDKLYMPQGVGRYFVDNEPDGTITIRKAENYVLIRRTQLDAFQQDCLTIEQELALFRDRVDRMSRGIIINEDQLPLVGKISHRGIR